MIDIRKNIRNAVLLLVFAALACRPVPAGAEGTEGFTLPASLPVIEEEAFAGIDATTVVIPEGTESIGSRAFADCDALRYIVIPDGLSNIAEDTFDGSLVIFVCSEGSSAAAYAENHGIPVTNP